MSEETILVPIDFTGCAYEVVSAASDLAARLGTGAVLLCVVELPDGVELDTRILPATSAEVMTASHYLDDDAREQLKPFVQIFEDAGVKVRGTLRHGEPAAAILALAEELPASMIVMGTHGRKGLKRLFEGSVAEAVIRGATCPVTTIRTLALEDHPGLSAAQEQVIAEAAG